MQCGGLIWTTHARERLAQRFGMVPEQVVDAMSEPLLEAAARMAIEVRVRALNLCLKMSGDDPNVIQTVVWIKPPGRRRQARWRVPDDE